MAAVVEEASHHIKSRPTIALPLDYHPQRRFVNNIRTCAKVLPVHRDLTALLLPRCVGRVCRCKLCAQIGRPWAMGRCEKKWQAVQYFSFYITPPPSPEGSNHHSTKGCCSKWLHYSLQTKTPPPLNSTSNAPP